MLCTPSAPDVTLFARTTLPPPLDAKRVYPPKMFALKHVEGEPSIVHAWLVLGVMVTPFNVPERLRFPVMVWVPTKVLEPKVA